MAIRASLAVGCLLLLGSSLSAGELRPRPKLRWEYSTGTDLAQAIVEDAGGRPYLFAAVKEGGLLVLELSPDGDPVEVASIRPPGLGGLQAMNLAQQGNRLFLALGSFFSPDAVKAGLAVVDVSDPTRPEVLSLWKSKRKLGGSATVLVEGDRAYLGAMDHGVFIFEVSDGGELTRLSKILPDVDFPRPDPNSIQHPNARGLALRNDLLYVANDAGGLRVIDVEDPTAPSEIGKYLNPNMPNKPSAYNNVVIDWPYAYIAVDYCGLEIVDVSDPAAMVHVSWWNPWSCELPSNLWFNSPGHTNQLVFDPRKKRVYLSAGDSELRVVSVRKPRRPRARARYGKPQNGQGAWGVGLTGETIYLAYIRAIVPFQGTWSGIRALERRRN